MRAVAVLRERYGFTASESLEMSLIEFEEWLEALVDEDKTDEPEAEEVWEAVGGKAG
jgi:hypothetical protein